MKLHILLIILFLVVALPAQASQSQVKPVLQGQNTISQDANINLQHTGNVVGKLVDVTLGLAGVLIVIGAMAWGFRRFSRLHVVAQGQLRLVGGMHLGARERLVLVQVGEKQLLLGVTPGRIVNLHTLEELIPLAQEKTDDTETFSSKLSALLQSR